MRSYDFIERKLTPSDNTFEEREKEKFWFKAADIRSEIFIVFWKKYQVYIFCANTVQLALHKLENKNPIKNEWISGFNDKH